MYIVNAYQLDCYRLLLLLVFTHTCDYIDHDADISSNHSNNNNNNNNSDKLTDYLNHSTAYTVYIKCYICSATKDNTGRPFQGYTDYPRKQISNRRGSIHGQPSALG